MNTYLKLNSLAVLAGIGFFIAFTRIAMGYPNPPCTESGPHTNAWSCLHAGTVNSPGALSYTTANFYAGSAISPPVLTAGVTFNSGQEQRLIWYDCNPGLNHWQTNSVTYTSGPLYFVPSIPTTISSPGVYTYTAKVDGSGTGGVCPVTATVGTVTITTRYDPNSDDHSEYGLNSTNNILVFTPLK